VNYLKDRVLLVLLGLLGLTVSAFFLGVLPYPFGILILLVLIVSRLLYKQ
jgi:ABC-type multidrug transport system permease subunit